MIAYNLDPGTKIIYYLQESLQIFIGYINRRRKPYIRSTENLYYLVSVDNSTESKIIVPEQILGYETNSIWRDIDTGSSTTICDIVKNFSRRFGFGMHGHKDSIDSLRYAYMGIKGEKYGDIRYKSYYDIPKYDMSAGHNKKKLPSLSEQLKKKLKRIEVNGEYMTAVWYVHPATVIKLSENDMYDTEKAYMWLLLKGLCDNNKSECDRVLKLMEDITFEKK